MNPYPLALLNHLTLPVIRIVLVLPCNSRRQGAAVTLPVTGRPPGGRGASIKKDRASARPRLTTPARPPSRFRVPACMLSAGGIVSGPPLPCQEFLWARLSGFPSALQPFSYRILKYARNSECFEQDRPG